MQWALWANGAPCELIKNTDVHVFVHVHVYVHVYVRVYVHVCDQMFFNDLNLYAITHVWHFNSDMLYDTHLNMTFICILEDTFYAWWEL